VIDRAVKAMSYSLEQRGFELDVDVDETVPPIRLDADALEQAILNLLSNAIKYSGSSRKIGLRFFRQSDHACIQVRDYGVGIPETEQVRIFERFHRVNSKENARIPGTGLGLALVRHAVEGHGGSVDVESRPGDGSTFTIKLPINSA
jgi:two-component system phosphate regulon sensor histidine kinase PhoR